MSTQASWTSPAGQEFTGTPEYIVGVKAGWDARGPVQHRADRLAARHHELSHRDDVANHPDGGTW